MNKFFAHWKKVLIVIFLIGAFFRLYHLGETSFVADEFLDINASYGQFKTGEWQAWDFNFERPDTALNANAARDERAFVYKWQVAHLFNWFAPTEATSRAVSAAWGLVTLLLVFQITTYFTKRKEIGLIAAFLYAISISALLMDRRLRMYAMFVPVFLVFSWMTYKTLEEKYTGKITLLTSLQKYCGLNFVYIVPALLLGALSLHLHLLTVNIAFIVVVYALAQMSLTFREKGLHWNKYTAIVIGFIVSIVGLKFVSPASFQLLTSSFSFPDNHYGYFGIVLKDYSHPFIALLFFGVGVWYMTCKEKLSKEGLWLMVSFLTPLLMAVFTWRRNVGEQYISFAQPFKIIVVAIGVYAVAMFFKKHLPKFGKQAFVVPLMLSLLILPNYTYFFQDDNIYHQTSQGDSPQYKKIFGYFMKNYSKDEVLITRNLRNYYVSGAHIQIENIGGERTKDKLTLERLQSILTTHQHGWVILSDNDDTFIANDAMTYIDKNMEHVSNPQVRGKVTMYRW